MNSCGEVDVAFTHMESLEVSFISLCDYYFAIHTFGKYLFSMYASNFLLLVPGLTMFSTNKSQHFSN